MFSAPGNIYRTARDDGYFIQFKRLRDLLEHEFAIPIRSAFYYDSAPRTDSDRKRHNYLSREVGFRVKKYELGKKQITCAHCSKEIVLTPQKCVDVAIAMSVMEYATKRDPLTYDPIILSTGDRDFLPVLERVRDRYDKDIILVAYRKSTAGELVAVTTRQIWIEDYYARVADEWRPKPAPAGQVTSDEATEHAAPGAPIVEVMKEILQDEYTNLASYEKDLVGSRKGRPWGFLLNNIGKRCQTHGRRQDVDQFLIEQDTGATKGANGMCLHLARSVWPGCEIVNHDDGYPYLVLPTTA